MRFIHLFPVTTRLTSILFSWWRPSQCRSQLVVLACASLWGRRRRRKRRKLAIRFVGFFSITWYFLPSFLSSNSLFFAITSLGIRAYLVSGPSFLGCVVYHRIQKYILNARLIGLASVSAAVRRLSFQSLNQCREPKIFAGVLDAAYTYFPGFDFSNTVKLTNISWQSLPIISDASCLCVVRKFQQVYSK